MKYLISRFLLRAVSAVFQTSRSEARRWYTSRKQLLPDSYPHNLPNSAKIFKMLAHGNNEILAMTLLLTTKAVTNKTIL
jgi:hypothetical protein